MTQPEADSLTLIEGAVLGVLVERPQHGFALAKAFAPRGWLGEIFTAQRPVVYRALKSLERKGMLVQKQTEESERGPERTIFRATTPGRLALREWMSTPVKQMRDVRLELLVKLALHEHLGLDAQLFIADQIAHFTPIYQALHAAPTPSDGVARQRALWRKHSSDTVMQFLTELQDS